MFLHMLTEDEKLIFFRLASLFSLSDNKIYERVDGEGNEKSYVSDHFIRGGFVFDSLVKKDEAIKILRNDAEEAILLGFKRESGISDFDFNRSCQHDVVLKSLTQFSKGSRESVIIRKEICSGALKDIVDVDGISISAKKVFLFEIVGLCLADGEITEIEQHLLDVLTEELGLDRETYDEVVGYCKKITREVREVISFIVE